MVCKKCGTEIEKDALRCPNCGDWKQTISEFEKELEKLKMGEAPSSLSNGKVHPNIKPIPTIDVDELINAFENLKVKEREPRELNNITHQEIDTENLEEVIEPITEDKDLYTSCDYTSEIYEPTNYEVDDSYNVEENTIAETEYNIEPTLQMYDIKPKENNIKLQTNERKYNNKRNLIIGISIFAFFFIIGVFILYSIVLGPKAKFRNALEIQYSNIINKIDNITSDFNDIIRSKEIQLNTTAKVTSTENGVADNYIINAKYLESDKEKKQYFEYTNLNKTKTELRKLYIQNNKLYVSEKNETDKYYIVDSKYISLKNFLNTDNIDYIVKIISKTSNKMLKNNNFKTKKATLKIDDKDYKVKEISLILSEKQYSKIYTEILQEIEKDKTALHILSDYSKYSMDEVKEIIDNKLEALKKQTSNETKFTYKIYMNENSDIIKQELNYDKYTIEYVNIQNKQELKIINDKTTTLLFSSETNEGQTTFSIKNGYEIMGEFIKDKASYILNFQITDNQNNQWILNSTSMKNGKENNRYDVFMAIQSNGFNHQNYIKNIEVVNTLEATTHFEIVDIPIQQNIIPMPINMKNELAQKFSMFIK